FSRDWSSDVCSSDLGLALAPAGDKLLVADFGEDPQIRTFDKFWQPVATTGFANPFATGDLIDPSTPEKGKKAEPGDPAPFNVTTDRKSVVEGTRTDE